MSHDATCKKMGNYFFILFQLSYPMHDWLAELFPDGVEEWHVQDLANEKQ